MSTWISSLARMRQQEDQAADDEGGTADNQSQA
jgi:hypothetical protein